MIVLWLDLQLHVQSGAVVVVIVWWLDLQLHVQSVPITTNVVSSNPAYGEVYSIQHYVIKFVSDLQQVDSFLRVLRFPPPISSYTILHFCSLKSFKHILFLDIGKVSIIL